MKCSFRRRRKRSGMDFGPTTGPPMAQEKAIAEAMNEQFVDTSSVSFAYS